MINYENMLTNGGTDDLQPLSYGTHYRFKQWVAAVRAFNMYNVIGIKEKCQSRRHSISRSVRIHTKAMPIAIKL